MSEPKITVDHLLGMHAIVEQLNLRYEAAKTFADENPDDPWADDVNVLRGFRNAYWSASHTLNSTAFTVAFKDRPTYDAYKEAISQ